MSAKFLLLMVVSILTLGCTTAVTEAPKVPAPTEDKIVEFRAAFESEIESSKKEFKEAHDAEMAILDQIAKSVQKMEEKSEQVAKAEAAKLDFPADLRVVLWIGDDEDSKEAQTVLEELKTGGVSTTLKSAWYSNPAGDQVWSIDSQKYKFEGETPQFWVCDESSALTKLKGKKTAEEVVKAANALKEKTPLFQSTSVESIPETWPANITIGGSRYPSWQTVYNHLKNHSNHSSDFSDDDLSGLSVGQLVTLHERDHGYSYTTTSVQVSTPLQVIQPTRVRQSRRMKTVCSGGVCYQIPD